MTWKSEIKKREDINEVDKTVSEFLHILDSDMVKNFYDDKSDKLKQLKSMAVDLSVFTSARKAYSRHER